MRKQNVGRCMFAEVGVQRRAIDRVSARRISAVRPINEPILQIELEIDRLRQTIEQHLDVTPIRCCLAFWDVYLRAKDAAFAGVRRPFLRPINFPALWINGDSNAQLSTVSLIGARSRVAVAGVDQSFDVRTIQVRAHHAHSFAVAPIEFAALLFEMELLRCKRLAFANDGYAILTV